MMAKLTNRLLQQTAAGTGDGKKKTATNAGTALSNLSNLLKNAAQNRSQITTPTTATAPKTTAQQTTATRRTSSATNQPAAATEATTSRGTTYNPATTTPGAADLAQIEGTMPTYKQSQALTDALNEINTWRETKPGDYQSPYAAQIEELYNKVSNPEKFSYDPNADPLYQMYADRYGRNARSSMTDTMAEAAALTGGYGNSYAQAAAQQAYDDQMQGLNDALPTLYNQAYGEYTDRQNQLLSQLQAAQAMDDTAYNRYRDNVSDYYTGLDALTNAANSLYEREYGQYTDALKQANTDRDYYLTKAASESIPSSGGGSSRKSTGTGTSANYKTILKLAQDMSASDAYNYVARMADQGYISNEEADKMLSMNLGVDVSKYVTSGSTGVKNGALSSLSNALKQAGTAKKTSSSSNWLSSLASAASSAAKKKSSTKQTSSSTTKKSVYKK